MIALGFILLEEAKGEAIIPRSYCFFFAFSTSELAMSAQRSTPDRSIR
jgi:hypothetical protein